MTRYFLAATAVVLAVLPGNVFAQQSLSLSVTPPLIQLSAGPGDDWRGSIKLVNSNPYDLTLYAIVVDFAARGETGSGTFIPLDAAAIARGERPTLGTWVSVPTEGVLIPAEQSADIPVTVSIPEDAPPGGHYAAVLIGTSPSPGLALPGEGQNETKVSSFVTSLLFVRIGGEVVEEADIRDFYPAKSFIGVPEAQFVLRFENKGNVHVLPQGMVSIYNMWGKPRGTIPVNQKTDFGSVLPGTTRRYELSWKGERSALEVGRYKAVAALTYGIDGRKTASSVAYFYVIPVGPVAGIAAGIAFVLGFLFIAIRRYVRKALELERSRLFPGGVRPSRPAAPVRVLSRPIAQGVMDLRRASGASRRKKRGIVVWTAGFAVSLAALGTFGVRYASEALKPSRHYEVSVARDGGEVTLSSEEVIRDSMGRPQARAQGGGASSTPLQITIVNRTDLPGRAAAAAAELEAVGYSDIRLTASSPEQGDTVVFYKEGKEAEAASIAAIIEASAVVAPPEGIKDAPDSDILVVIRSGP